ncbi:lisH domain-containing protein C1711.05-like [Phragmites australis]|uniref:lisH domain-containing protein C1711.05-like n=1 Tax=Phragmites australis TaxID=29695 RepID=UPI002D7871DC|nr:lisH domain-containing protein C1711.05-like [Phragmites australis]
MGLKSSARRPGSEESSAPRPKYNKVLRNGVIVEMEVITVGGEMSVDPKLKPLRKRMSSELVALRDLLKKAELLSCSKNGRFLVTEPRPEAPVEAADKTPSAKRRKVSPLVEQIETLRMSSDEREQVAGSLTALSSLLPDLIVDILKKQCGGDDDPDGEFQIDLNSMEGSVLFELKKQLDEFAEKSKSEVVQEEEEEEEYVDICGGVSPIKIASPLVPLKEAGETGSSPSSSSDSGSSSASDSDCDASTSDSDSDESSSDSESDSDESASGPAPPAVHLVENDISAQPPKPATSEQSEALERRRQDQRARARERAREKVRQEVLEVERAALPDVSIRPWDLEQLGIAEFEHIGGGLRAARGRPSVLQQLGFFLKADS